MASPHPSIYLSRESRAGCRTAAQILEDAADGHARSIWHQIVELADRDAASEPLTPASMFEGRVKSLAETNCPDWTICQASQRRIKRAALVGAVTGNQRYVRSAVDQISTLFDPALWPEWRDKAHTNVPADLRTGQLSAAVGLAYDWLYPVLSDAERQDILAGLEQYALRPFFESLRLGAWWITSRSNWTTCVVGGLGILGMALGDDHPRARELVEFSKPVMTDYLQNAYGPEGEFNESVGYSSATKLPMEYFAALAHVDPAASTALAGYPIPEALTWYMHFTLPPGRLVAFGDAHWDAPPDSTMFALAARVTGNPAFQRYYLDHQPEGLRRDLVYELLWFDPDVPPESPEGIIPKGKAYQAFGTCISSRSNWDTDPSAVVVCSKAGIEDHHEHNDAGQITIDGYEERLIIDPGSPSGYPADFFGPNRYRYYNASIRGHNILMVDGRELEHGMRGKAISSMFDENLGGWWSLDLTPYYPGAECVRRVVIHLIPGIIAVLDEADLDQTSRVSLRWHTVDNAEPDASGGFTVAAPGAVLSARVVNMADTDMTLTRRIHCYASPYDTDRSGAPLEQRYESYIDAVAHTKKWSTVSLFAVSRNEPAVWGGAAGGWRCETATGAYVVKLSDGKFSVVNAESGRGLTAVL